MSEAEGSVPIAVRERPVLQAHDCSAEMLEAGVGPLLPTFFFEAVTDLNVRRFYWSKCIALAF